MEEAQLSKRNARKAAMAWQRGDNINGGVWPPTKIYARPMHVKSGLMRVDLGYDNSRGEFIALVKLWLTSDGEVSDYADHRWKFEPSWHGWTAKKVRPEVTA